MANDPESAPSSDPASEGAAAKKPPRKPYATPRLTAYGNVAKLTQGGGSVPKADGGSGMSRRPPGQQT